MFQTKEHALLQLYQTTFTQLFDVLYDTVDPVRQARLVELSTALTDTHQRLEAEEKQSILEGRGPIQQLKYRLSLTEQSTTSWLDQSFSSTPCSDSLLIEEIQQYFHKEDTGYSEGGPLRCHRNQSKPLPPQLEEVQTGLYSVTQNPQQLLACFNVTGVAPSKLVLQFPEQGHSLKWMIWTYSEQERLWVDHTVTTLLSHRSVKREFAQFAKQQGEDPVTPVAHVVLQRALNALQAQHTTLNPWYWSIPIDQYRCIIHRTRQKIQYWVIEQSSPITKVDWSALSYRKQMQIYRAICVLANEQLAVVDPVQYALRQLWSNSPIR